MKSENSRVKNYTNIIAGARSLWKEGEFQRALDILGDPALKENFDAVFLMGEIHYNNQNWGSALNCFRKSLQINPEYLPAKTYVELILNILGFFHTDQFNP